MRPIIVIVAIVFGQLSAATARAADRRACPWSHTRPLSAWAADLVATAANRSPTVRAELQAIERTDLTVYVTVVSVPVESSPHAWLGFVVAAADRRYLVITIDQQWTSPGERIAWLGHELHHALEVAAVPDVVDQKSFERLYRHIGWQCSAGRYETDAARQAGHRVRREIGY